MTVRGIALIAVVATVCRKQIVQTVAELGMLFIWRYLSYNACLIGCMLWRYLVSACKVKAHPIGCWQYRLFLAAFGLNLVVVAVLRDSVGIRYIVAVLRDRLL